MRKSIGYVYLGVLFCSLVAMSSPAAQAAATCFCKISHANIAGLASASGVCQDLTSVVNVTYGGLNQQNADNQRDCANRCNTKATPYTGSQAVASSCCSIGAGNGSVVKAYAAVGTKAYEAAQSIGTLTNQPAVTTTVYTCPATWLANQTNVPGGVTADGKCKKASAQPITITPLPPNGTAVGTYGFTWGNVLYAWGTAANGGAPTAVTHTTPAVCHF